MFCIQYNISTPFPVTEQTLCYFSAYLADQTLAPQTIKIYLAAVRSMQISLGLPDPRDQSSMPLLKRVQAGIWRVRMEKGSKSPIRLPVTLLVLEKIRQQLVTSQHPHRQLMWAISAWRSLGSSSWVSCCRTDWLLTTRLTWPGATWQSTVMWHQRWCRYT